MIWFYSLFNSVSVLFSQLNDDNEKLCALKPSLQF